MISVVVVVVLVVTTSCVLLFYLRGDLRLCLGAPCTPYLSMTPPIRGGAQVIEERAEKSAVVAAQNWGAKLVQ